MTKDDWKDLVYWISFAGAFMTTIVLIHLASYILIALLLMALA